MERHWPAGDFLVTFPLYCFCYNGASGLGAFLTSTHPDGDIATPLFTDKPAAVAFLEAGPLRTHYSLVSVIEPIALLGLLLVLEKKGYTHVNFDPHGSIATTFAIPALRQCALAWFDSVPTAIARPST